MSETNPEIQALIDVYGEATVRAAFAIAQSIGRDGIRGIDFSGAAEREIRQSAHGVTERDVTDHIEYHLRT